MALPVPIDISGEPGHIGPVVFDELGSIITKEDKGVKTALDLVDTLKEIDNLTWGLTVTFFLVISVVSGVAAYFQHVCRISESEESRIFMRVETRKKPISLRPFLLRSLWTSFGVALDHRDLLAYGFVRRSLLMMLLMMSFTITEYYNGQFASSLSVISRHNINSIEDLVEAGMPTFFLVGHPLTDHFKYGTRPVFKRVFENSRKVYGDMILQKLSMDVPKILQKYVNQSAFISSRLITSCILRYYCNRHGRRLSWKAPKPFAATLVAPVH